MSAFTTTELFIGAFLFSMALVLVVWIVVALFTQRGREDEQW
jgi:uncharacterized membrane protein